MYKVRDVNNHYMRLKYAYSGLTLRACVCVFSPKSGYMVGCVAYSGEASI